MQNFLSHMPDVLDIIRSKGVTLSPQYASFKDKKIEQMQFFTQLAKSFDATKTEVYSLTVSPGGALKHGLSDEGLQALENYLEEIGFAE